VTSTFLSNSLKLGKTGLLSAGIEGLYVSWNCSMPQNIALQLL
jgi:hypothetical protein